MSKLANCRNLNIKPNLLTNYLFLLFQGDYAILPSLSVIPLIRHHSGVQPESPILIARLDSGRLNLARSADFQLRTCLPPHHHFLS